MIRPALAARAGVLAAGLIEREAGVAGGVCSPSLLFTTFFVTLLIVKPLEEAARR